MYEREKEKFSPLFQLGQRKGNLFYSGKAVNSKDPQDFPGGPVVSDSALPLQEVWV